MSSCWHFTSVGPLRFRQRKCDKGVSPPARNNMVHFVVYFARSITYACSLKLIVLLVLHVLNLLLQIIRIAFRVADFIGQSVDKVLQVIPRVTQPAHA